MDNILIYSSKNKVEALGIQHKLDEHNIPFQAIDKTDSSYAGLLGEIEIYVDKVHEPEAKSLIKAYFED